MITCPRCGAPADGLKPYCTNCGAPLPSDEAPHDTVHAAPQPYPYPSSERPPKGTRFAPMSIGAYVGTILLLALPVVNAILLIVWACGGCINENRRNLARAILIIYGVCVVLAILLVLLVGGVSEVTDIINEAEISALCRMN